MPVPKLLEEINQMKSALAGVRPRHVKKVRMFSREWYAANERAFVEAMEAELTGTPSAPPRNSPHQWTEEEIETLKRLWSEGMSLSKIAEQFGLTTSAVNHKVGSLGLPRRYQRSDRKDELLKKLWAEGVTFVAMAKDFGVTAGALEARAKRLGLPP
jgi:hypothetical protein